MRSFAKQSRSQKQAVHKIGLYIRVSTEEQASNPEGSIRNQEQRLRAQIDLKNFEQPFGEVARVFIDRARSGKDTNRPELQSLLKAVTSRDVTMVMVSELSRLSRSIKDFSDMWELMRSHGCQFLSLREQFDTTSAAGEMVMYTIANIAQFERRQTSERISANFLARAQRGLFNGGSVPLGYRIESEKPGYLSVHPEQAEIVRLVFKTFLEEGIISSAGKKLNALGCTMPRARGAGGRNPRLHYFTVSNLHRILTNQAYIGLKAFRVGDETQTAPACWDPIIDVASFEQAQEILKKNFRRNKRNMNSRYPFLLSGLVACATCGDRMPGRSAWGKKLKIPYYAHGWSARKATLNPEAASCCTGPVRILSRIVEPLVWNKVLDVLTEPERARKIVAAAQRLHLEAHGPNNVEQLKARLIGLDAQLEALAEHLTQIPKGVAPAPIFSQMKKLEETKETFRQELEEREKTADDRLIPVELASYESFVAALRSGFERLGDDAKANIVQKLIAKVEIHPEAVTIHYRTSKHDFAHSGDSLLGEPVPTTPAAKAALRPKTERTPIPERNWGSTTLTNGGPGGT